MQSYIIPQYKGAKYKGTLSISIYTVQQDKGINLTPVIFLQYSMEVNQSPYNCSGQVKYFVVCIPISKFWWVCHVSHKPATTVPMAYGFTLLEYFLCAGTILLVRVGSTYAGIVMVSDEMCRMFSRRLS